MEPALNGESIRGSLRISVMCGGSRVFGLERMALAVVRGLSERGHDVFCLVSAWGNQDYASRLEAMGIPYLRVPLGKVSLNLRPPYTWWTINALAHLPSARRRCREHLSEFKPHIIIFYDRDWMVMSDRSVETFPTVFHVHGPPSTRSGKKALLNKWRMRRLDRRTAVYVSVSESLRQYLLDLGIDRSKTSLIYNGVEATQLPLSKVHNTSVPTLGIVGQIAAWKGHDDLIEALHVLQSSGDRFDCRIFGMGEDEYTAQLRAKIAQYHLEENVHWEGYRDSTDEIFRGLDMCIVPSRVDETFGLVAAEAGLRGIPVVATTRGALPEVVQHGETGMLVPPESPGELAEAIRRLLRSPELRHRLGLSARQRVLHFFTEERMIAQMEELCLRVAGAV